MIALSDCIFAGETSQRLPKILDGSTTSSRKYADRPRAFEFGGKSVCVSNEVEKPCGLSVETQMCEGPLGRSTSFIQIAIRASIFVSTYRPDHL